MDPAQREKLPRTDELWVTKPLPRQDGFLRYATTRLIGGPADGLKVAIPADRPVYLAKAAEDDGTETYRREQFAVSETGVISVFVHESMTLPELNRMFFDLVADALDAKPTEGR